MTKRWIGVGIVVVGVILGGLALAQTPGMPGRPMGPHMMSGGGPGMMGGGMGMGCPLMMPGAQVKVEKIQNGATITLTSNDPKMVSRIQKRAEIMRLMHELEQEEMQSP